MHALCPHPGPDDTWPAPAPLELPTDGGTLPSLQHLLPLPESGEWLSSDELLDEVPGELLNEP